MYTTPPQTPPSPVHHQRWTEKRYQVLSSLENKGQILHDGQRVIVISNEENTTDIEPKTTKVIPVRRTNAVLSTGAALSLPPKKKDIYRPYSLDDRPKPKPRPFQESENIQESVIVSTFDNRTENTLVTDERHSQESRYDNTDNIRSSEVDESYIEYQYRERSEDRNYPKYDEQYSRPAEDISAAHAILDLSASTSVLPSVQLNSPPEERVFKVTNQSTAASTVAYTYEAFFVSDGRSKKKILTQVEGNENKPKYACTECGKQYATSSNLSRHKQTHRSLDSQSAKKCMTCGKTYVSMPALAMHLLTHKLSHGCGVCGKLFSRPWLLQGHLRSHTGEKPYGCAHCGKAFADRSNLRAHMQTHSSDKNYICNRCNKSFALKSYLNKHLESACFKDGKIDGEIEKDMEISTLTPPQSPSSICSFSL